MHPSSSHCLSDSWLGVKSSSKKDCNTFLISNLPYELQSMILQKLDGQSIASSRLVCKLWRNLIKNNETYHNVWKKCCLHEIPTSILTDLLIIYAPFFLSDSSLKGKFSLASHNIHDIPASIWKGIYGHYRRSVYVRNAKIELTTYALPDDYGPVTCLEVCDNDMYVGFNDGTVVCYNEEVVTTQSDPVTLHKGNRPVESIIAHKSGTVHTPVKTVISVHGTSAILVTTIYPTTSKFKLLNYHSTGIDCISRYGNHFTTCARCHTLLGQPIWRIHNDGSVQHVATAWGHLSQIVACSLWMNQLICVDTNGSVMSWTLDFTKVNVDFRDPAILVQGRYQMTQLLYRQNLIMSVLGVDRERMLYTNYRGNQKVHDVFAELSHIPEIICLNSAMLAIGTKSAFVYLYVLQHDHDWDTFDLKNFACCVKVDGKRITGLYIDDHGTGPIIIVTSDVEHITLIHWQHN